MEKLLFWLTRKQNFSCKNFFPSSPYYLLCKEELRNHIAVSRLRKRHRAK